MPAVIGTSGNCFRLTINNRLVGYFTQIQGAQQYWKDYVNWIKTESSYRTIHPDNLPPHSIEPWFIEGEF